MGAGHPSLPHLLDEDQDKPELSVGQQWEPRFDGSSDAFFCHFDFLLCFHFRTHVLFFNTKRNKIICERL